MGLLSKMKTILGVKKFIEFSLFCFLVTTLHGFPSKKKKKNTNSNITHNKYTT